MLPPFSHPIALAVSLPRGEFLTLETLRGTANYNVVRYFKRDAMPREVLPHGQPGILIAAEGTPETIRRHLADCQKIDWLDLREMTAENQATFEPKIVSLSSGAAASATAEPLPRPWKNDEDLGFLGVTIITPAMRAVGAEAVRRFQEMSGLPVLALNAPSDEGAHALKLRLAEFVDGAADFVIWFDADWWALRPLDLSEIAKRMQTCNFLAVKDPGTADAAGFVYADIQNHGMDATDYFNGGFWVAERKILNELLSHAGSCLRANNWADYGEQSALNCAVQRLDWLTVGLLPREWNFFMHAVTHGYEDSIPARVIGLHAAGVPMGKKLEHLRQWAKVLSYPIKELAWAPKAGDVFNPNEAVSTQPIDVSPPPVPEPVAKPATHFFRLPPMATFTPISPQKPKDEVRAMIDEAMTVWVDPSRSFDARASAKCFLGYRVLDGQLGMDSYSWMPKLMHLHWFQPFAKLPLGARWRMSELYLDLLIAVELGDDLQSNDDFREYTKRWAPAALNAVKAGVLLVYDECLKGDKDAAMSWANHTVSSWREAVHGWDMGKHPYWPTEMAEALRALQVMAFILRRLDLVQMEDHDWCPISKLWRDTPWDRAMRKLGGRAGGAGVVLPWGVAGEGGVRSGK